jgi:hypothetical protein
MRTKTALEADNTATVVKKDNFDIVTRKTPPVLSDPNLKLPTASRGLENHGICF